MNDSDSLEKRTVCVYNSSEPLCRTLDKAGVPPDAKWRTLILYMRGIEAYDFLSEGQKSSIQHLVLKTLKERNFTDENFQRIMQEQDEILNGPCNQKLHNALAETAVMIEEFRTMLHKRRGDVESLGDKAVETIRSGGDPNVLIGSLKSSFQEIVDIMRRDAADLDKLSRTDPLTGLSNRRGFDGMLDEHIDNWICDNLTLSLLMVDIDHFKKFNDSYGHRIGDQALITVAKIMRRMEGFLRDTGVEFFPSRYGGEEFAVILPAIDEAHAMTVAEDLRQQVERYNFIIRDSNGEVLKRNIHITISVGVAEMDASWRGAFKDNLVDAADKALYRVKAAGRNNVLAASSG